MGSTISNSREPKAVWTECFNWQVGSISELVQKVNDTHAASSRVENSVCFCFVMPAKVCL
jgi:hypothetical protein